MKNAGLSLPADVAREQPGAYPVKKKGQPRELNPNWEGIAWLEAATLDATEPEANMPMQEPGLVATATRGRRTALLRNNYIRPMIEVIPPVRERLKRRSAGTPCSRCADFSRSWNCPEHADGDCEPVRSLSAILNGQIEIVLDEGEAVWITFAD